jgi:hypothetical protein
MPRTFTAAGVRDRLQGFIQGGSVVAQFESVFSTPGKCSGKIRKVDAIYEYFHSTTGTIFAVLICCSS